MNRYTEMHERNNNTRCICAIHWSLLKLIYILYFFFLLLFFGGTKNYKNIFFANTSCLNHFHLRNKYFEIVFLFKKQQHSFIKMRSKMKFRKILQVVFMQIVAWQNCFLTEKRKTKNEKPQPIIKCIYPCKYKHL